MSVAEIHVLDGSKLVYVHVEQCGEFLLDFSVTLRALYMGVCVLERMAIELC